MTKIASPSQRREKYYFTATNVIIAYVREKAAKPHIASFVDSLPPGRLFTTETVVNELHATLLNQDPGFVSKWNVVTTGKSDAEKDVAIDRIIEVLSVTGRTRDKARLITPSPSHSYSCTCQLRGDICACIEAGFMCWDSKTGVPLEGADVALLTTNTKFYQCVLGDDVKRAAVERIINEEGLDHLIDVQLLDAAFLTG
jgi:hypothetical protein